MTTPEERDCIETTPKGFTTCYHCGELCTGDVTEAVCVDGTRGDLPVCDDAEDCSRRCEKN